MNLRVGLAVALMATCGIASAQLPTSVSAMAAGTKAEGSFAGMTDGSVRQFLPSGRAGWTHKPGPGSTAVRQIVRNPKLPIVAVAYQVLGKWNEVVLLDSESGKKLSNAPVGQTVAFSADGTELVIGTNAGISLINLKTRQESLKIPLNSVVQSVAMHPGGQLLAAHAGNRIEMRKLPSGELWQSIPVGDFMQSRLAFGPDGTLIAVANSGLIYRWDLTTGDPKPTLQSSIKPLTAAVSDDGTRAAFVDEWSTVEIWDLKAGRKVETTKLKSGYANALAVTPDTTFVGTLSGNVQMLGRFVGPIADPNRKPSPSPIRAPQTNSRPDRLIRTTINGVPVVYAEIDLNHPSVTVDVAVANGFPTGDESFGSMVSRSGADIAMVGTFFDTISLKPVGDIVTGGRMIYSGRMGTVFTLTPDNEPGMQRVPWGRTMNWDGFETVLGCGPALVMDGEIDVDASGEGFRDPSIFATVPRMGLGFTANRKLLLVATGSGQSFTGFARTLKALGCEYAMNLDAGSSRAFYYRGTTLIRPGRQLTNIITVHIDD